MLPCLGRSRHSSRVLSVLLPLCAALFLALSPWARAVVISSAAGTGNTNAPADDPGWSNVGILNGGSGIYLGANWVLTASHVGAGTISFGGVSYDAVSNSVVSLTNGVAGRTMFTDLILFQLTSAPAGLAPLTLASSAPTLGAPVTMIGAGLDRGAFTEWSVNTQTNPWAWTVVSSNADAAGYQTLASRSMRWGTNTVGTNNLWINVTGSAGPADVRSFATVFDILSGPDDAQAVNGDSGGAVFTKSGSAWELGGVMIAAAGYSGQPSPATHAIDGNRTFSADLSFYREQIMSVVPEPSTYALLALSASLLVFVCWRRRKAG